MPAALRLAVVADVHGNLRALEAVMEDLRTHAPDLVLNLGDHLSGPLEAAGTADVLREQPWIHIRGNHDRQLLDRPAEAMGASDRAAHAQLTTAHKQWLAALPPLYRLDEDVLLCHGIPASDLEYLAEDVDADGAHLASEINVTARLSGEPARLVLCGHSHIPRSILTGSGIHVVNPGSVGLPAYDDEEPFLHFMENGSPHARYAILDRRQTGWRVRFMALEYDWRGASERAAQAGRPDWAYAIATGYALRTKRE